MLDLDAEVHASYLSDLLDWLGQYAETPNRIVDVGAGTGTGTLALARRFPSAEIVAIDSSASMLERLGAAARAQGLTDRVRLLEADLDDVWPGIGSVDLAWAASSLHHFADPGRVLRDIYAALNPGGLLVALEMDGLPRFLPQDVGHGEPGLEARVHEEIAQAGWNSHPDWHPHLEQAGFEVAAQRTFDIEAMAPAPKVERYARAFLTRVRSSLEEQLTGDDLAALDHVLTDTNPDALLRRRDLTVRGSRTVWVARRR
jgi:SAM-dependent methyltransferase